MTLRLRLNCADGQSAAAETCRGTGGWREGMKDGHTEMEVNGKAAEESELVSRQRNTGGEVEGGGSRERSIRTQMKKMFKG